MGGTFSLGWLAWRSLAARPVRSVLTAIGIALGVGVLAASLATSAGIDAAVDRTVVDILGRADLRVAAFQEAGLSAETIQAIRATGGVEAAASTLERRTYLRRPVAFVGALPAPVSVLGIEPDVDASVHALRLAEGAAIDRPDAPTALITERLATEDGYGIGGEVTIQALGDSETFRIVGIIDGDGPILGSNGRTVVIPMDAARRIFGAEGVDSVDLTMTAGSSATEVIAALEANLTREPYVLSTPTELASSLRASTADFQATTALIAAIALFVGAFLIFNTFSMTLSERVRELGLLRAAGATRRQAMGFVLTGALIVGVIGAALGVFIGLGLAALIAAHVRTIGAIPIDDVAFPLGGATLAFLVGLVVTVAAALEPAWRAGRIPPIEALRAGLDLAPARRARLRWLVVVFAAVAVVGLLAWPRAAGEAGIVTSLAVYAILLGATLLSPFLLGPLGRLAGIPFAAVLALEERLARGSLARDRSRTALTLGALTIGLAMIVAIGGVAQDARRSAGAWLEDVVPGDEVLTSIRPVGLDEGVEASMTAIDGVARVTPIARFDLALRGARVDAAAVIGSDLLADGRLTFVAGDRATALASLDRGGTAIVAASVADRLGLTVGDLMSFAVGDGRTVRLTVSGVAERTLPGAGGETILVGWSDAVDSFGVAGADVFAVRFAAAAGTSAGDAARASVHEMARERALEPAALNRIEGAVSDALGRVFALFDALAVIAVLVAALGIVNTLTMNVVERVREIGVLRATGMTRRQVRQMIVVEAGVLGLVGAFLGVVVGLLAGAVLVGASGGFSGPAELPWGSIGLAVVLGVAASMAAAYYPARIASGLPIVRAVQFE
ncbi:MAG: FtsX-like permease family protein [Chloroflexota bacterium]